MRCEGIFISMWRHGTGSLSQEFITYICFDDDILILPEIFSFLFNKLKRDFSYFELLIQIKGTSLWLRVAQTKLVFCCPCYLSVEVSCLRVPVLDGYFRIIFIFIDVKWSFMVCTSFLNVLFFTSFVISGLVILSVAVYFCHINNVFQDGFSV